MKYALLSTLVIAGGAGGLYLSGGWPAEVSSSTCEGSNNTSPVEPCKCAPRDARFPLHTLDIKDTVEAPALAADAAGAVYLTWASKTSETERTIFLTRTTDQGLSFAEPKPIARANIYKTTPKGNNKSGGYERRATPHVAVVGDLLHLSWCDGLPNGSGIRLLQATSADGGSTFGPNLQVQHGEKAKPTFTAMSAALNGAMACSWLDDRSGAQQPFVAVRSPGAAEFADEQLVYSGQGEKGVCPCCPTAVAYGPDGSLYVAFRNIRDGYRDIAISRLRPGQAAFEGPFLVMSNTWKFDGCPHDGPSIAFTADRITVLWMDARSGPQKCYQAWASVADMKFSARDLHPGSAGTQGNAKLVADRGGTLHAVWEESLGTDAAPEESHAGHQHGAPKVGSGGGRAILYARMKPGAAEFSQVQALAPKPGAFQTRPSIVTTSDDHLFVAWNELDASGKAVVVTRLPEAAKEGARP
jgi:hypothetical protein